MKKIYQSQTSAYRRGYVQSLKRKVFDAYGGFVCACCGETEPKFLQLDHINNDGYKHRMKLTGSQKCTPAVYNDLIKRGFPPTMQVLCANCNFGKYRNGGICPHKTR